MSVARMVLETVLNSQLLTAVEIPVEQLDSCYALCAAQDKEGLLVGTFEPGIFKRNWETFIKEGDGTIIGLYNTGSLCGVLGGLVVCDSQTGCLIGKSIFYYIRKDVLTCSSSLVLFTRFQQWAFAHGATSVMLTIPLGRFQLRLDHLLQRNGYQAHTTTYKKLS